jgi:hypothetical protein
MYGDKLQSILDELRDKEDPRYVPDRKGYIEKKLREKYPALQDAWEQYQTVLRLCKEEEQR